MKFAIPTYFGPRSNTIQNGLDRITFSTTSYLKPYFEKPIYIKITVGCFQYLMVDCDPLQCFYIDYVRFFCSYGRNLVRFSGNSKLNWTFFLRRNLNINLNSKFKAIGFCDQLKTPEINSFPFT